MVKMMRKKIVIIAAVLLVLGGLLIAQGIVEEKKDPEQIPKDSSDPWSGFEERQERAREAASRAAFGPKPSLPDIPGVVIAGGFLIIGGIIFLAKSKDEEFLPNI